ncbi:hypothetical protein [Kribbella sp. DT2]|uniref:hypothetical protein n=1 Tax=Kribbella sp. DT2 TaxID=3393427 RepID=UPI003CFA88F9
MTKLLLSIHVIAAILAIGPVAVAASRFPAATRRLLAVVDPPAGAPEPPAGAPDPTAAVPPAAMNRAVEAALAVRAEREVSELRTLHRICRVYAVVGIAVPAFGLATARSLDVLGDPWLIISITLTAIAAAVLVLLVLPGQERVLTATPDEKTPARLAMHAGLFNLLWATVTVLMITRPGSTTGV